MSKPESFDDEHLSIESIDVDSFDLGERTDSFEISLVAEGERTLGRYELVYEIGQGGMASVFLARAGGVGGFEKWFAIKRIHDFLARDKAFLNMFYDEARIAAALQHPNVVQVFDLGEADRKYFLAMEYLHGEPLSELLKRVVPLGGLRPEVAAYIIARAAEGLNHAHKATDAHGNPLRIIHRDVSPQNIFVTYDGQVKVTDFGVAKASNRITHTATGLLKGKIAYASPEQILGEEIDHRSDIFALGTVLWESSTGRRLFRGKNDGETIMRISSGHRIPPGTLIEGFPDDLEWIINRALAQHRDARYDDAARLAYDIDRFLLDGGYAAGAKEVADVMQELFSDEMRRKERILSRRSGNVVSVDGGQRALRAPAGLFEDRVDTIAEKPSLKAPPSTSGSLPVSAPLDLPSGEPSYSQMRRRGHSGELPTEPGIPPWAWILPTVIVSLGLLFGLGALLWPKSSVVRIETDPTGATVELDGTRLSRTTPMLLEEVEPGIHRLHILLDGYHREEASFEAAGGRVNLHYALRSETAEPPSATVGEHPPGPPNGVPQQTPELGRARLRITSQPAATIYVDDQPVGRTPLLGFEVAAGRHELKLVSGRLVRRYRINASSGETVIRSYRLR